MAPSINKPMVSYNVMPPFDSVQLVYKSNFTMVYGIYNELVTGANLSQLISWGPHIVRYMGY